MAAFILMNSTENVDEECGEMEPCMSLYLYDNNGMMRRIMGWCQ